MMTHPLGKVEDQLNEDEIVLVRRTQVEDDEPVIIRGYY